MQTIRRQERTGKDGALSLRIPLGQPDVEFDVLIVVQPKKDLLNDPDQGWPPNYFDNTFGSIDDDSFVRPSQGELPKPVVFD